MIDLRSDTVTKPTNEMREVIFKAEVGDDVWGEDPTIIALERKVAALLGKEAALFLPSGTMSNQIAINIQTRPGDEVFCADSCHLFNYEGAASPMISGVQLHTLLDDRGIFTLEQLEEAFRPADHHFAPTRLVSIENTANRGGGTVWPIRELRRISEFAHDNGMNLHLDGARLWNAAVASGTPEADWATWADRLWLS